MNFVSRESQFVSGNIEIRGKQNSLFPKGPVIKCLLYFLHGQGQKSEQKPTTKKFVEFHNHSPLLTMLRREKYEVLVNLRTRTGFNPYGKVSFFFESVDADVSPVH